MRRQDHGAVSGQNIPFAAKVTWGGAIEVTNAVGGVEVCLASGIRDKYTGIDWKAGTRNIQGMDALQFLRTRKGVGDGGTSVASRTSSSTCRDWRASSRAKKRCRPGDALQARDHGRHNITPSKTLTNPLTLVQIALAVKNVPFNEIVFLQYPVNGDPDDANRVVPNKSAADTLWAALEANQPLQITGEVSQGDGVGVASRDAGRDPRARPAPPTPAPTETAVEPPSAIAGQTAAQETCSNGNVKD